MSFDVSDNVLFEEYLGGISDIQSIEDDIDDYEGRYMIDALDFDDLHKRIEIRNYHGFIRKRHFGIYIINNKIRLMAFCHVSYSITGVIPFLETAIFVNQDHLIPELPFLLKLQSILRNIIF